MIPQLLTRFGRPTGHVSSLYLCRSLVAEITSRRSFFQHGERYMSSSILPPSTLNDFGKKHVTKGLARISDGIMVKGKGSYVEYLDGKKMLDFTCGIGVTNLGMS